MKNNNFKRKQFEKINFALNYYKVLYLVIYAVQWSTAFILSFPQNLVWQKKDKQHHREKINTLKKILIIWINIIKTKYGSKIK